MGSIFTKWANARPGVENSTFQTPKLRRRFFLSRWCVGAHYFQYIDEPTAGRSDGENYQIGWVDATDTPYAELVRAGREVGTALYSIASGVKL